MPRLDPIQNFGSRPVTKFGGSSVLLSRNMSEDKAVKDIVSSQALPCSTDTHTLMLQPSNLTTHTSHDDSVSYTQSLGARPKLYTSTPVKFTAEDSVFPKTETEQKSKSFYDSIIEKQLQRIQDINRKYDELASSKLQQIKVENVSDFKVPLYGNETETVSSAQPNINTTFTDKQSLRDFTKVTFSLPNTVISTIDKFHARPQLQTGSAVITSPQSYTKQDGNQINVSLPTPSGTLQANESNVTNMLPQSQQTNITSSGTPYQTPAPGNNLTVSSASILPVNTGNSQAIKRKEKEPDKFDGRNIEWRDYIVHFEQVSTWNNWSPTEKAQQLAMSLRGQAQKLLGELKPGELNNYESLKRILSQRYDPQERSVAYRCEFRARKRQKNESPSDFAYALRRLACLAYPDMPYDCREINVLEQYLNSVGSTELKEHVIFQHPLDAAISHTVEYEAVKGNQVAPSKPNIQHDEGYIQPVKQCQKDKNVPPNTYKELNDLIQTLNICMEKWNKTLEQLQQRNKQRTNVANKDYSNFTCFICKQKGHIARNCPNKATTQEQLQPKKSEN